MLGEGLRQTARPTALAWAVLAALYFVAHPRTARVDGGYSVE